ncbi:MAG: hypothetical protein JNJ73_05810 [Hyphomonadaceae bacterium]|nr:hypothetical protein [Hyphomonadaceae bacterium]
MTRRGFWMRMAVAVAIDLLDFTYGRIPILGTVGEGVGGLISFALWGPIGLVYLGELADVTEQIDGFIPTASLLGLYVGWRNGFLFRRGGTDVTPAKDASPQP